ncbi:MAG: hypothetical protein J6Q89_02805 [Clostridia bacterium]|nr:hypothetical protein [Clostridia bacterium]
MNTEKIAIFKMRTTADATNLKELIKQTVKPLKWEFSDYIDSDGEKHNVLAMELETSEGKRGIYRTEVRAFIEKFNIYNDVFGTEPVEDRPAIVITGVKSQRGNPYINFEIVEE